eukprot:8039531-Alexandrium_andersonii.AAC.1
MRLPVVQAEVQARLAASQLQLGIHSAKPVHPAAAQQHAQQQFECWRRPCVRSQSIQQQLSSRCVLAPSLQLPVVQAEVNSETRSSKCLVGVWQHPRFRFAAWASARQTTLIVCVRMPQCSLASLPCSAFRPLRRPASAFAACKRAKQAPCLSSRAPKPLHSSLVGSPALGTDLGAPTSWFRSGLSDTRAQRPGSGDR